MNRLEFVDRLRSALSGSVSEAVVEENINFYSDYILSEMRKGRSEEDVLALLGDPRLIARTIIETNENVNGEETSAGGRNRYDTYSDRGYSHQSRVPAWLWGMLAVLVIMVIMWVIFSVMSFLAPVIIPILLVVFLVKLFRDWLN